MGPGGGVHSGQRAGPSLSAWSLDSREKPRQAASKFIQSFPMRPGALENWGALRVKVIGGGGGGVPADFLGSGRPLTDMKPIRGEAEGESGRLEKGKFRHN